MVIGSRGLGQPRQFLGGGQLAPLFLVSPGTNAWLSYFKQTERGRDLCAEGEKDLHSGSKVSMEKGDLENDLSQHFGHWELWQEEGMRLREAEEELGYLSISSHAGVG